MDHFHRHGVANLAQHLQRGMVMKTIHLDTSIDYTSWDINEVGSIEMTEWQPIETAPNDEWILAYQPHGVHAGFTFLGGHCYVCKWAYGNEFWYDKSSNILEIQDMKDHTTTYFTCVPTHWMPLPPCPAG